MAKDFPILRVGLAQAEQDLGHQLEVIDYGGGRRDMLLGDDSNLALFASLAGADAVIEYHNPPIQSYMVIGSHAAGTPVRFKDSSSSCNTSFKDYTGLEAALRDQGFLNN